MLRLKDGITQEEMAKHGFLYEEYATKNKNDISASYFYDTSGNTRTIIAFDERPREKGRFYFYESGVVDWGRFKDVMENFAEMVKEGLITNEP